MKEQYFFLPLEDLPGQAGGLIVVCVKNLISRKKHWSSFSMILGVSGYLCDQALLFLTFVLGQTS